MELYLYSTSDVSPNALRSTWNPDRVYISKEPCRTNMSHEVRTEGWCGTTSDVSMDAIGVVDTDQDGWFLELEGLLPDGVSCELNDIGNWIADDDSQEDFECDVDTMEGSRSCTWDEDPTSEAFYPEPRDGWEFLATYDVQDEIWGLSSDERKLLDEAFSSDNSGVNIVTTICESLDIDHDRVDHDTYNSGACGTDWSVVLVKDDDIDVAVNALQMAARLYELVGNTDIMMAMLKVWWDRA